MGGTPPADSLGQSPPYFYWRNMTGIHKYFYSASNTTENLTGTQTDFSFETKEQKPIKTKQQLKQEADEVFNNFKITLLGRDVGLAEKQRIVVTLLDNYKTGSNDLSNRSRALLLDLFTAVLNAI